jgi:hypothetical protein
MASKWVREKKRDYKLSEESAREEVFRLLDFYGIEIKETENIPTDDEEKTEKTIDKVLDELAEYYRRGVFENRKDEKNGFCVVQRLTNGEELVYREMQGRDRLAHGKFDAQKQYNEKVASLLGRLCGLGDDAIIKFMGDNHKAAATLALVFFVA